MSGKGYETFPVRKQEPLLHDDDCACEACEAEVRARNGAARKHKNFILCSECKQSVRVNRGPLKTARKRAIANHRKLMHGTV